MVKSIILTVAFFLAVINLKAGQPEELLAALKKSLPDSNRINIQLALSDYFLFKPKEEKADLDASLAYSTAAFQLARKLKLEEFSYRALKMKAALNLEIRNIQEAEKLFFQVAGYYHKTNPMKEAAMWIFYGDMISPADLPNQSIRHRAITKAYQVYESLDKKLEMAHMKFQLAGLRLHSNELKTAERMYREVIDDYKAIKYPKLYHTYHMLALVYYRSSEYKKALAAAIEEVRSYESQPDRDPGEAYSCYDFLGAFYFLNGNDKQAVPVLEKCLNLAISEKSQSNYFKSLDRIVKCYVNLKNFQAAIRLVDDANLRFPVRSVVEECQLVSSGLRIYSLVNRKKAEAIIPVFKAAMQKYYDQMLGDPVYTASNSYIIYEEPLLNYFFMGRQWDSLEEELTMISRMPDVNILPHTKIKLLKFSYKLDSAKGRSVKALQGFQQMTRTRDSLERLNNASWIDELEAKYRSVSKDKTIKNLSSKASLQQSRLANANLQRNVTFAGVVVFVFIATMLYIAYRNKQKNNEILKTKQAEINKQNKALTGLIEEKEKLLEDKDILLIQQQGLVEEKEWLIKEVHHRVKNNLQIVMSLLYTQSAYLQNIDAVEAIRDVQHRVQAISIIHQKLYQKSGGSTVTISDYINEIVSYLSNSYNITARKIRFELVMPAVHLDIAQAVPMGLIINEAITNSLKYAFMDKSGKITIKGILNEDMSLLVCISDNGVGLPADFDIHKSTSLGMEMMKALGKQLGGDFQINSDKGVKITISFKIDATRLASLENSLVR